MESRGSNERFEKIKQWWGGLSSKNKIQPLPEEIPLDEQRFRTTENQIVHQDPWPIPDRYLDGKTMFIFGKSPNAEDAKYQRFESEHQVKIIMNVGQLPRRALGIIFFPNGSIRVRNLSDKPTTYGHNDSETLPLEAGATADLNWTEGLSKMRVDIPGGLQLAAGDFWAEGGQRPRVRTFVLKTRSQAPKE